MNKAFVIYVFSALIVLPVFAFASSTDGTIDSSNRYAWHESGTWFDFGTTEGAVHVTDSSLTGFVWSSELGWISLNCSNDVSCSTVDYKVANDGNGTLSGYAWSESAGWIDFRPAGGGVSINSSGIFSGYAWSDQIGWISFNCSNDSSCSTVDYKVLTDWRPQNSRSTPTPEASSGSISVSSSGSRVSTWWQTLSNPEPVLKTVEEPIKNNDTASVWDIIRPRSDDKLVDKPETPKISVPTEAPLTLQGKWNLLSNTGINALVFAPIPRELAVLTEKFPRLQRTFNEVGIKRMSDLDKLEGARLVLPGISERAGVGGGIAVPIAALSDEQKRMLPSGVIFAKSGNLIDYDIKLAVSDDGIPEQKINTISGKPLDLAIRVNEPVNKITGYLVTKDVKRNTAKNIIPASSLLAAPIMASLGVNHTKDEKIDIEQRLVIDEFQYTDDDNDGIYTARINAPVVRGEYEVISILEYKNISLGKKELRLTTVVDPEGYIYEENGNKETRIPDAVVTLYAKDSGTGEFLKWPARDYAQTNPQKTDKSGTYSFLVPFGTYKLYVTADGYESFTGQPFDVVEGVGVHDNIRLKPKSWWRNLFGLFN